MKKVKKKAPKKAKRRRGGATLPCPRCDSPTSVVETRREENLPEVRRRRRCRNPRCRHEFMSRERADA